MFPVTPAFFHCLVWLVSERGEGDRGVIRWQIDIDKLWQKMKERHRESKADIHLGICLDSLTFALSAVTLNPCPPDLCPLPTLCSDGCVGEWAGRPAEDAGPGEPQLFHAGEEDLRVEPPAADTAIRSVRGGKTNEVIFVCVLFQTPRRDFPHNKNVECTHFRYRPILWDRGNGTTSLDCS